MLKKFSLFITLAALSHLNLAHADGISSAEKVYKDVSNSIFMILDIRNHDYNHPVDFGSAVAVTQDLLATNCHIALKGEEQLVKMDSTLLPTTLLYKDENQDLCLLKINKKILKPVTLRSANTVRIGEEVFTIGSPKGYERTISRGIISNKIKYKTTAILQTDAAISPGSSGGGLFDTESHLIGLTFSKNLGRGSEGIGFALPAELITSVVSELEKTGGLI